MRRTVFVPRPILAFALLAMAAATYSTIQAQSSKARRSLQDWPTGHYKVVDNWPKPLPNTRHSHDGWTWGSFGGVYAESPDRIWVGYCELKYTGGRSPLVN